MRDQKASVALMTGVVGPPLIMIMGIAVELTSWTATRTKLQRISDMAALAGGTSYAQTRDALSAANSAADVAELNGAAGTAPRVWDPSTNTLTDGQTKVQIGAGVRAAEDKGITVTVAQDIPLVFTKVLSSLASVTIKGVSSADVGTQPCLLALGPSSQGVVSSGSSGITLSDCTVRSNSQISTNGGSVQTAKAFYAATSISGTEAGGTLHPNSPIVADPFANFTPIQSAFARLSPGSGAPINVGSNTTASLSPGIYSSWSISGTATLSPGIYYVNGPINIGSQAILSGSNVTIVTSGALYTSGQGKIDLSAAPFDTASGAIPGVVFAGNSTSASSMSGGSAATMTGAVYYPNGALTFAGGSGSGKSCLEIIANSISLVGNSTLSSNGCFGSGAPNFGSMNRALVALVK